MFEFVRTHKKWMQILLALIILPSFVLVGVSSMTGGRNDGPEVATVGGEKITQQQWDEAQRVIQDRARASQGAQFDPKQFESPEIKQEILEDLIAKRVLAAEVKRSNLTAGTASIKQQVEAPYRDADGKINVEAYKAMLTYRGMTEAQLFQSERDNMTQRQLNVAIEATSFVPRTVSSHVLDLWEQEREVQDLVIPLNEFIGQVKVTDAMVKAYYDKNSDKFQAPEQVKVEYVVMDPAVVESQIVVSDAEVADYYDKNKDTLGVPEQRYTSHILIAVKDGASAAEKAAAKAKAEAILAEVRKAPATFADVAKTQSQDPESAVVGGELGLAAKASKDNAGSFASPELEAASYKLKQGEFDLVATRFGFHVITVNKLVPGVVKPLDEIKPKVVAELKKSKLPKKYAELAEKLTNTVYEQADSLKPAAELLHVQVQTVENLGRTPSQSPALASSPINHPKFLKAIFADDAIKNKRNTEAVETLPNTMVSGRVVEYKPAAKRPLAEVDQAIRMIVARDEAVKLARQAGEAKLAALKASGDATGFGAAKVEARSKRSGLPEVAMREVFKADVAKLPAYVGVELPGMGYGIYRINKASAPAKPDTAARASLTEQINGVTGQAEMLGYVEALKTKAKAKILKPLVVSAK
jgi:peptidyl-prolyl cis-trans isomerase D